MARGWAPRDRPLPEQPGPAVGPAVADTAGIGVVPLATGPGCVTVGDGAVAVAKTGAVAGTLMEGSGWQPATRMQMSNKEK